MMESTTQDVLVASKMQGMLTLTPSYNTPSDDT